MSPTAFRIDPHDARDGDHGVPRFASYLIQHKDRFKVSGYDGFVCTDDAAEFAGFAFDIGNTLMSPPYVDNHRLVLRATPHWDQAMCPALSVDLAMPVLPEPLRRVMTRTWHSWQVKHDGGLIEPEDNSYNNAFARLTVRIPYGGVKLPAPRYVLGAPAYEAARDAVAALVTHVNAALVPFLQVLNTRS